jgi:hypothetical protein
VRDEPALRSALVAAVNRTIRLRGQHAAGAACVSLRRFERLVERSGDVEPAIGRRLHGLARRTLRAMRCSPEP